VPTSKYLIVSSTEAHSGKSAVLMGLAKQLQAQGWDIGYGKLFGTATPETAGNLDRPDGDLGLFQQVLGLSSSHVQHPLLFLDQPTILDRVQGRNQVDYHQRLRQLMQNCQGEVVLLEGPATFQEGALFDLSLVQISEAAKMPVLVVIRFHSALAVEAAIAAQQELGDCLLGVLINEIPEAELVMAKDVVKPFLENRGIPVLGLVPQEHLLRAISANDLVYQLQAEVLCGADRLGVLLENLTIGAMNVNSAMRYFQRAHNMVVVTGGDRTDLQMAAMETSAQCLVLTGHMTPDPIVLQRAEEMEIPILSVDLDTMTTVELINKAFHEARLQEPVKIECIERLMAKHFNFRRLYDLMCLEPATSRA